MTKIHFLVEIPIENFEANGESVEEMIEKMESVDDLELSGVDDLLLKRKIKVHTCHVCQAQFARANHLTRHMTLHRAVLTHKCDRCDQVGCSKLKINLGTFKKINNVLYVQ